MSTSISGHQLLIGWATVGGPLREGKGRTLLGVIGIALGVALGVAVNLINQSAVNEFSLAVQNLSGEADLVVSGPSEGFDENIYPTIAKQPEVLLANPALELAAKVPGRRETLNVLGLDVLRAARLQPALVPDNATDNLKLLDPDSVFLSESAAAWLGLKQGDLLPLQVGLAVLNLKVAGLLPPEGYSQRLAVMDIAGAQWRFQQLGRINRISLRLRPGTDVEAFRHRLQAMLPPGVEAALPSAEGAKATALSRAYRVNLTVLALVALFTGAFLVFSTQALAVLRRRAHLALLRVLGLTRNALLAWLVAEGALIGAVGAALGVALGYGIAAAALRNIGSDLGGGFFAGVIANPKADPMALGGFFALGVLASTLGALVPALESARTAPACALKAGDQEEALGKVRRPWHAFVVITLGLACALAPPINGLPLFGYGAVALILAGGVMLMPVVARWLFAFLPSANAAPEQVALAQLKGNPGHAAVSMAAILVSFSLMVSMAIMVASFRQSVNDWLSQVLPADLYLRAAVSGDTAFISPAEQDLIARTPGVKRVDFQRSQDLLVAPGTQRVTLIARPMSPQEAPKLLPLRGEGMPIRINGTPPAWVSEAVSDRYGIRPGRQIHLPIGGKEHAFTVAGVWRDYARQAGAIVIDRNVYIGLTGDRRANSAALWLEPGASYRNVSAALRENLPGAQFEIATPGEIRTTSLEIFDRSFAVTYLLEAVAVAIGLFGISSGFSAQVLARRGEFGMLRHIGMTRRQIGAMLSLEGGIIGALGVGAGLALGWILSLLLIHVINRQSFHWSMDLHAPGLLLAGLAVLLAAAAALTAAWSGRHAAGRDVIAAVREDW